MELTGYTDKNAIDIPIDEMFKHDDSTCYVFRKENGELALYNCSGELVDHKTIDFNKVDLFG